MNKMKLLLAALMATILPASAEAGRSTVSLAGDWRLDTASSSSIKPWEIEILRIAVDGDAIAMERSLSWDGHRKVTDLTRAVADDRTVTKTPVTYWVDTWYNNCYIGGDRTKSVRARWLARGKRLELRTRLTLEAQQGDIPVEIADDYRLSEDGSKLELTERRSTRDQVLNFQFLRQ